MGNNSNMGYGKDISDYVYKVQQEGPWKGFEKANKIRADLFHHMKMRHDIHEVAISIAEAEEQALIDGLAAYSPAVLVRLQRAIKKALAETEVQRLKAGQAWMWPKVTKDVKSDC